MKEKNVKTENELLEKAKSFSKENEVLGGYKFVRLKTIEGPYIIGDISKISSTRSGFDSGDRFITNKGEEGIFIGLFRQMGTYAWIIALEKNEGKVRLISKGENFPGSLIEKGFKRIDE